MKKTGAIICLLFFGMISRGQEPVRVIFDSDMGPDYDDVGAIAMLHHFADSGKANILATIASTNYEGVAAVMSTLNTYFGRPNIPIALPQKNGLGMRDSQHWSDSLRANYPHSIDSNAQVPEAVELYRRLLSGQPDHSVTIITVGFFTNMAALLQSKPDQFSPLDGRALIQKKVTRLVSMAGRFPGGKEFNVTEDKMASKTALEHWPTEVIFSGFEIGEKIRSGLPLVEDSSITHSPVRDVFRICMRMAPEDSTGRKSWDETAVLVGITGVKPFYDLIPGRIVIHDDGSNGWINKKPATQFYLVEKVPAKEVSVLINRLIMHQPAGHQSGY